MGIKKLINSAVNLDGWTNMTTWLGRKGHDRISSVKFCIQRNLTSGELVQIYRGCGIGKRIVDLPSSEMVRQWFTIQGDPDNLVLAHLEEIKAKAKILEIVKWARLFGGAIGVMGINDGGALDQPVNERNIRNVEFIHVFDKTELDFNSLDVYSDETRANYNEIEFYNINSALNGHRFKVHESRVIRLDGDSVPNIAIHENMRWGDSIIQSCYNEIKNIGSAYNSTSSIIEDFIQTVLKINNLSQLMASDQDRLVKKRLELIDTSRSVANTLMLDGLDDYSKQASSVSGLNDLIKEFCLALSCVTGIPYAILMGQSPSGMQATGDADIRMFYDKIKSKQEDWLQPALEKLVRYVMISKDGPFRGVEPKNWKICFNPLWQMTETETAAYRKTIAETDTINISNGTVDPIEVRESRFGQGTYSAETVIDMSLKIEPPEVDETKDQKPSSKETRNED